MKISPARRAAFEILNRIEDSRAFSSVLLPQLEEDLSPADRGLCHEIVLGVLRRKLYLDKIIDFYSGKKKLDTEVRTALRMGAYQITSLDRVPAYSAINESVNLVQAAKKTSAKGLVNAILRRISERVPELSFADDVERVSIETSHPRWLIEKWIDEFGSDETAAIAHANNQIPRVAFRMVEDEVELASRFHKSEVVEGAFIAEGLDRELRELADDGRIYFQDEASQLVASATSGEGWFLDVCAAPGGKTTQIAKSRSGRMIVAGDLHASRIDLLKATCKRQGAGFVHVVQYDAAEALPFADGSFDTVLVDAPCSGTGTIRHNPEIRYFLEPGDFHELATKQRRILKNASNLVRPGGRLIYSTCSLEKEENEAVCFDFLRESGDFRRASLDVPDRFKTADGFGRTFPHRDGTDGFFISGFERAG